MLLSSLLLTASADGTVRMWGTHMPFPHLKTTRMFKIHCWWYTTIIIEGDDSMTKHSVEVFLGMQTGNQWVITQQNNIQHNTWSEFKCKYTDKYFTLTNMFGSILKICSFIKCISDNVCIVIYTGIHLYCIIKSSTCTLVIMHFSHARGRKRSTSGTCTKPTLLGELLLHSSSVEVISNQFMFHCVLKCRQFYI